MSRHVEVVAAVIYDSHGRIFATQRGYGEWKDWWEFPGGKIEEGEKAEDALHREIHEELDVEIDIQRLLKTIEYDYPEFHLTMHCYACVLKDKEQGDITLIEHEAAGWLSKSELRTVRWLPADIELIEILEQLTLN